MPIPPMALEYDEINIHRSGADLTVTFLKDGEPLFQQPVTISGEGDVLKIAGLKGKVTLEFTAY